MRNIMYKDLKYLVRDVFRVSTCNLQFSMMRNSFFTQQCDVRL